MVSCCSSKPSVLFVDSPAFSVEESSDMYGSFPLRDYRPPCRLNNGVAVAVFLLAS